MKRHTVMVELVDGLRIGFEVDLTIVGIKAPLAAEPKFHMLIMDRSTDDADAYRDDTALYYLTGSQTLGQ